MRTVTHQCPLLPTGAQRCLTLTNAAHRYLPCRRAFLQESCGGAAILEELEPPLMTVTVPSTAATLPLLFGRLAEAKQRHNVQECTVTYRYYRCIRHMCCQHSVREC